MYKNKNTLTISKNKYQYPTLHRAPVWVYGQQEKKHKKKQKTGKYTVCGRPYRTVQNSFIEKSVFQMN